MLRPSYRKPLWRTAHRSHASALLPPRPSDRCVAHPGRPRPTVVRPGARLERPGECSGWSTAAGHLLGNRAVGRCDENVPRRRRRFVACRRSASAWPAPCRSLDSGTPRHAATGFEAPEPDRLWRCRSRSLGSIQANEEVAHNRWLRPATRRRRCPRCNLVVFR